MTHKKTPDLYSGRPAMLKTALCQIYTEPWDLAGNLARTLEALETAGEQGAELAITPECVLHGYASERSDNYAERLLAAAERLDGPRLERVRALARAHRMGVVLGFAERGANDAVHNSAAFIGGDGSLLSVYRKVHLRPFEDIAHQGRFVPGDEFHVRALHVGERSFNIGIMICFDREIVESARCLRALNAHLIACPLACDTSDLFQPRDFWDNEQLTRARAAENEVFIAVVNHAGRFNGGSFVVGPGGEALCQLGRDPEVRVLELPVGIVQTAFHALPFGWLGWGYRRAEVYRRYLG